MVQHYRLPQLAGTHPGRPNNGMPDGYVGFLALTFQDAVMPKL
jgi:hypothetical protein